MPGSESRGGSWERRQGRSCSESRLAREWALAQGMVCDKTGCNQQLRRQTSSRKRLCLGQSHHEEGAREGPAWPALSSRPDTSLFPGEAEEAPRGHSASHLPSQQLADVGTTAQGERDLMSGLTEEHCANAETERSWGRKVSRRGSYFHFFLRTWQVAH